MLISIVLAICHSGLDTLQNLKDHYKQTSRPLVPVSSEL